MPQICVYLNVLYCITGQFETSSRSPHFNFARKEALKWAVLLWEDSQRKGRIGAKIILQDFTLVLLKQKTTRRILCAGRQAFLDGKVGITSFFYCWCMPWLKISLYYRYRLGRRFIQSTYGIPWRVSLQGSLLWHLHNRIPCNKSILIWLLFCIIF